MHIGSGPQCPCSQCQMMNWYPGAQINAGGNSLIDYARGLGPLGQAGLVQAQQAVANNWRGLRDMTRDDLGIVDQNLDDKVGMDL